MPQRQVVVDDTDPAIHYGPSGWFVADAETLNGIGNFGPIYNSSSHGTSTDNSTLSFAFNGTSISVMGTINVVTDANNVTDPTWDCFLDQIEIESPNPTFKFPENNWVLCEQPQIAAGSHVLTVQVHSKGQAFYLDNLLYTPTPDVTFPSAVLVYPNTDTSVNFGGGWSSLAFENSTQTTGAQVSLNFIGTSVSMYGFVPTELPHNATTASYTIDAPHNLVVTYGGDNTKTPLVVSSFYVTNFSATATSRSTSDSPSRTSSSSSSASPVSQKKSPTGAIIGGILGCVAVLAILAGVAFWCRKRRQRLAEQNRRTSANPYPYPLSMSEAAPSVLPPSTGPPYAYAAVPFADNAHPYVYPDAPSATTSSGGVRSQTGSNSEATNNNNYHGPYMHPAAPLPLTDTVTTSSRSRGTHSHSHNESHSTSIPSSHGQEPVPFPFSSPYPASLPPEIARKHRGEFASAVGTNTNINAPQQQERPVVVRHHQDSGVRLNSEPETRIVELPPDYTRE
ncbi:hypothetical protein B0H10DRAFT_2012910 [Mycena sp. CBHHK59/15]|nr:hypothetical protein B0H10DRAFT_2012910 [Mycena sp. CBHHK59/15]